MATAEQQERLWYKIALAFVVGRLLNREGPREYSGEEKEQLRSAVRIAVHNLIEERQPVTTMEWYNLAEEFKERAWRELTVSRN